MRWPGLAALALVAALIGGTIVWLAERGGGGDRARVERIVHDYVLAHPEIIPQAMQKLQEGDAGQAIAANRAEILTPFGNAWTGNSKGDVTLVEYYDYNCGYCRASLPTIKQLVAEDPKLRVVFHELPILAESSRPAAEMSLAAAAQGKFPAFHDALFGSGPVTDQSIAAAARAAGVDTAQADAMRGQADDRLRANLTLAGQLGMTGTPTWIIGDRVISGALPIDDLKQAIAQARAG